MHASCPGPKIKCVRRCLKKKKHIKKYIYFFILEQLLQKTFHLKKLIKCVYTHTTLGICLFCLFVRNGGYT